MASIHATSEWQLGRTTRVDVGPATTVLGIPVSFDLSSIFAVGLATWTFADAVFPEAAPGQGIVAYWASGLSAALLLVFSIAAHELAHAVAARRSGLGVQRVVLSMIGGATELDQPPSSPWIVLRIASAGPVASFGLAVIAALAHVALVELDADSLTAAVAAVVAVANLTLGVLNLIPGLPLDGGQVLRAAVWAVMGRAEAGARVARGVGQLVGFALIALALLSSASGDAGLAVWSALLGLVITAEASPRRRRASSIA